MRIFCRIMQFFVGLVEKLKIGGSDCLSQVLAIEFGGPQWQSITDCSESLAGAGTP
jgi:hypothetical protein